MKTIKLMPEYQMHPLWDASSLPSVNLAPDELPISTALQSEIKKWAEEYEETLNFSDPAASTFPSKDAEAKFKRKAEELAARLKAELGDAYEIVMKV